MNIEIERKKKIHSPNVIKAGLLIRYPKLSVCSDEIDSAYDTLARCFRNGGRLLLAGNGGSAADSEHISGELVKSFRFHRDIDPETSSSLKALFGEEGKRLGDRLEGALPAIPLATFASVLTAYANDADPTAAFAQALYGCARPGDAFLAITTSGNSENILKALMTARAKGLATICLTGRDGGRCGRIADVTVHVPEDETYLVQELHLPVYHALCAMLEADFFGREERRMDESLSIRRDEIRV